MTEGAGPDFGNGAHRHTRRVVLGAAATLGMLAPVAPAALAATASDQRRGGPPSEHARPEHAGPEHAGPEPDTEGTQGGTDVWGTSVTGQNAGVRGNGRVGVAGEGTHAGITGDGFVGVRGTSSLLENDERGVGVLAEAAVPGSTALRTEGPSDFHGVTRFSRSGVATVSSGAGSVTVRGVELTETSAILATLQHRVSGSYLHAVETDAAAGSFTIFLTGAASRDLAVAWFALG